MDVSSLVEIKKNPKIPDITPGDTVRVSAKIVEGGKERIQVFQGVVIKIKRGGNGAGFTVRHVAFGVGVERTFPYNSPLVDKVEIVRQGKVRRSRLYYLRGLSGKEARRKIKRVERKVREQVGEELLVAPPEEEVEEPVVEAEVKPEAAATPVAAPEAKALEAEAKPAEVVEPEPVAEKPSEPEVKAPEAEVKPAEVVEPEPVAEKLSEPEVKAPEAEAKPAEVVEPEPVAEKPAEVETQASPPPEAEEKAPPES
jgi:large subunit ribosomal protein L19